jgi:hypothetical protein
MRSLNLSEYFGMPGLGRTSFAVMSVSLMSNLISEIITGPTKRILNISTYLSINVKHLVRNICHKSVTF